MKVVVVKSTIVEVNQTHTSAVSKDDPLQDANIDMCGRLTLTC